jgi:Trk K+ transport system NAD-binding subunit
MFEQPSISANVDRFMVCGLGSLGQHCVVALKEFGVDIRAIDLAEPTDWEIPDLPMLLSSFVRGDCRQPNILERAGIGDCRGVFIVTSDERVNIEAAFAVRLLNPKARLIVRSSKQNLNQLINSYLGDFIAFEATQLSAPAFAIAALSSEVRGFISLPESLLRVVKIQIGNEHPWCNRRTLSELNNATRRILSHIPLETPLPSEFHVWEPNCRIRAGDLVAYVEVIDRTMESTPQSVATPSKKTKLTLKRLIRQLSARLSQNYLQQQLESIWQSTDRQQSKRVLMLVVIVVLSVFLFSLMVLKIAHPDRDWLRLIYIVSVMFLGAYDAVFPAFDAKDSVSLWLRFMNLGCMMVGTASIAVLYALLTEWLLSAKFQLPKKRPSLPDRDHVVLIGSGRVGQRVASFLEQLKQPLVAVSNIPLESSILPNMPLVVSDLTSALTKVNLETARSVAIVTDDEMTNLEIGLMVHAANPACAIAIRVFNSKFGENISQLVPYAKVLSAYELSAEAFVAAAFGENVLSLIRVNEQTVLATEYQVVTGDPLDDLLLSEIAYGYGVVSILHQREQETAKLMPSDDIRVRAGDRLVVLANVESLHNIDRSHRATPNYWVQIERAGSNDAIFDGERAISRVTGCTIVAASQVMHRLPQRLSIPLYHHQAQRLVRELRKAQVVAEVIEG